MQSLYSSSFELAPRPQNKIFKKYFCFVLQYWGSNPEPYTCKSYSLPLHFEKIQPLIYFCSVS